MRVLVVSGDYYPNLGGVPSLFGDITSGLLKAGHEVTVLTRRWPGLAASDRWNGCEIVRLDYPVLFERLILHRDFLCRSPLMLWRVARLLRTRRIDTVCIALADMSAIYVLPFRRFFGFRLVTYLHGSDETKVLPEIFPSYRRLMRWILRASNLVIPVSEELGKEAALLEPSTAVKTRVIHNGVNIEALQNANPYPHPRPYAAFLGRLVPEKGVHTLLEAFHAVANRVQELDLVIAGSGREESHLQEIAHGGPGAKRIHFLGGIPRDQCYSVIQGARFLVLPSEREGHPIVAIEARVAGKPLLGSNIPGIARLVQDGRTGVLFRQGDAGELAALIEKYGRDETALAELTQSTRSADAESFDMSGKMLQHIEALRGS